VDFPSPLVRGQLLRRYKRFFADVRLDAGGEVTVHCPNPGSMMGLCAPGLMVWLSRSDDPRRKLAHTLEMVEADGTLIGTNTMAPNRIAAEAIAAGQIAELAGYPTVRREVKYGAASRVDFLLEGEAGRCWVEVKGVTLSRGCGLAEWPDSVSARGARHVLELEQMAGAGDRAVVLFIVQRADCDRFALAADIDPAFARALEQARIRGVETLVYACGVSASGIGLTHRIPWEAR
jgi:sugar fermentation stimulation protein A